MSTPAQDAIDAWIKQHGRSRESLAASIISRAKELGSGTTYKVSSLRVLLPQWAAGERLPRADTLFQQAIAEVLDRPLVELFPSAIPPERAYALREFPRLGAIDLLDDVPFDAFALADERRPADALASIFSLPHLGKTWVTAPPGAGRSLAVRRWQAKRDHQAPPKSVSEAIHRSANATPRVIVVRSLAEIAKSPLASAREALVLKVDLPSPQDAAVIDALAGATQLLVLAGFPFPARATEGWQRLQWAPGPSWRAGFVRWVAARVAKVDGQTDHDSTLDAEAMIRWLDERDPDLTRYATPGDLLTLLALADELPESDLLDRLDRTTVTRALAIRARGAPPSTIAPWCAREGGEAAACLLEEAFSAPGVAWPARLALDAWSERVPDALLPHGDDRLAAVRETLSRGGKGAAQRALTALEAPDRPRQVIAALSDAGILHPVAHDRFEVGPRWAQDAVARQWCTDAFTRSAPAAWGRLAVDPARRHIVDDALDALDDGARLELVQRALDGFDPTHLGDIGAVESLYVVVGELLARRQASMEEQAAFTRLWRTASSLWVQGDFEELPGSRTRGVAGNRLVPGSARWWAACWGWSLGMPRVKPSLPDAWAWLFPGWFPPLVAPPDALRWHDGPRGERGVEALYSLAPRVLARWTGVARSTPSAIVRAAAICLAPKMGWKMGAVVGSLDAIDGDLARRLTLALDRAPDEQQRHVLRAIWEVALGERGAVPARLWPASRGVRDPAQLSPLALRLRDHFPVDLVAATIAAAPTRSEGDAAAILRWTPPERRSEVFDALLRHWPEETKLAIASTDLPDATLLTHAVDSLDPAEAWPIAQRVWQLDPARAHRRATEDWVEHGRTAPWLESFSLEQTSLAVQILGAHPERPVPAAFLRFLARSLSTLGPDADIVFALLQRAGWNSLRAPLP